MLYGKFTRSAEPVLRAIRRNVKRPRKLPSLFEGVALRWQGRFSPRCPMGMLPGALSSSPSDPGELPKQKFQLAQIRDFYEWFDRQHDALAVMDFIWPRKKPRGKAEVPHA